MFVRLHLINLSKFANFLLKLSFRAFIIGMLVFGSVRLDKCPFLELSILKSVSRVISL